MRTPTSRTRAASTSSAYPAIRAWLERVAGAARPHHDRRVSRRAFASASRPSPTGSLHLGNALSAVANRAFADERRRRARAPHRRHRSGAQRRGRGGGDPRRSRLARGRVGRGAVPAERARRACTPRPRRGRSSTARCATPTARSGSRARRSSAPDGTATYQLATVADDLELGITHIIRGSDHRPNEEVQRRDRAGARRRAARGDPPRSPARRGREEALEARTGTRRSPTCATRASRPQRCAPTSTSSGCRVTTSARPAPASTGSRSTRSRRCPTPSSPRPPARRSSSRARCAAPARSSRRGRSPARSSSPAPVVARRGGRPDAGAVRRAPRRRAGASSTRRARVRSCAS